MCMRECMCAHARLCVYTRTSEKERRKELWQGKEMNKCEHHHQQHQQQKINDRVHDSRIKIALPLSAAKVNAV